MGDADYAEMQNRLTPLAGDDAPFGKSARELLGIAAYKAKKYDEARKYLEPLLIDPNASEDLQERVKIIMGDMAAAEVGAKAPPPASVPGAVQAPAASVPTAAQAPAAGPAKTEAQPGAAADAAKK